MNVLERAIRGAIRPPPQQEAWEWMGQHCYHDDESSRRGQKWSIDTAPFLRKVIEAVADPEVRDVSIMCSAQSAKTMTIMMVVCWIIANDPGPLMWVMAAADEVGTFKRERLYPTMERCQPVRALLPQNRTANRALEIKFATMSMKLRGANSKSKVQSVPVRWLILDEKRNYPPFAHGMLAKRTRGFSDDYKKIDISTPAMKDDIIDLDFRAGDQNLFYAKCPHCDRREILDMFVDGGKCKPGHGLKWDDNETTHPGGQWNFDEMAKTIRYEFGCGHLVHDIPMVRRQLMEGDDWRPENKNAPRKRKSFNWGALLPEWVRWRSIVEEYLNAYLSLLKGDDEPMKTFYTETLGQPYHSGLGAIKNWDFLAARKVDYRLYRKLPAGEKWSWSEELPRGRFAFVDVQGKGGRHYRWVARAFGANGKSRLIDYGTAWSMDDLKTRLRELEIPEDNIGEDCGNWQGEVFGDVIDSGYKWKAMRGDKKPSFTIDKVKSIWQWVQADSGIGRIGKKEDADKKFELIRVLQFSSPSAKDRLAAMMMGTKITVPGEPETSVSAWEISVDVDDEYLSQVTAEERDADGKWEKIREHNHFGDCEHGMIIMAMASGLIWVEAKKDPKQEELALAPAPGPATDASAPSLIQEMTQRPLDEDGRTYLLKQW